MVNKVCMWLHIQDIITYATFGDNRLRGFGVARGQISRFPIDLRRRPYNTLPLPCDCVIRHAPTPTVWASDSPILWTSLPAPLDESYRLCFSALTQNLLMMKNEHTSTWYVNMWTLTDIRFSLYVSRNATYTDIYKHYKQPHTCN